MTRREQRHRVLCTGAVLYNNTEIEISRERDGSLGSAGALRVSAGVARLPRGRELLLAPSFRSVFGTHHVKCRLRILAAPLLRGDRVPCKLGLPLCRKRDLLPKSIVVVVLTHFQNS